jgi:anti-sigma B factor antagonist
MSWLLRKSLDGDLAILQFGGPELDCIDPAVLDEEFSQLLADPRWRRVVISFEHVRYLCSSDIGVLLRFWKRCRADGRQVRLAAMNPMVHKIFELTRLTEILSISGSVEEALLRLGGRRDGGPGVPHATIASRAYEIWLAEGRPDGRDTAHWLQAEHEVLGVPAACSA